MFASSFKSLFSLFLSLFVLISISSAVPLTSSELATRATKLELLRSRLVEKRLNAHEKAKLGADIAAYKIVEKCE
ncbi:hypothetical protein JCM16303_001195 [Sporobolomyces ruberrimus]